MIEAILNGLEMIGMAMLLLLGAWAANSILGMYNSVALKLEGFDKKKLVVGLLRAVAIGLGTGLTSVVISALPIFLNEYGISIGEAEMETFSVLVISGLYAAAIIRYLKQCVEKIKEILK